MAFICRRRCCQLAVPRPPTLSSCCSERVKGKSIGWFDLLCMILAKCKVSFLLSPPLKFARSLTHTNAYNLMIRSSIQVGQGRLGRRFGARWLFKSRPQRSRRR